MPMPLRWPDRLIFSPAYGHTNPRVRHRSRDLQSAETDELKVTSDEKPSSSTPRYSIAPPASPSVSLYAMGTQDWLEVAASVKESEELSGDDARDLVDSHHIAAL